MSTNKQALRNDAIRAGGGKWYYLRSSLHSKAYITDANGETIINVTNGDVPAKYAGFLESANPATVLAMLDELEAAENLKAEQTAFIVTQEKWIKDIEETMISATDRAEAAEKRIAELELRPVALPPLNEALIAILGRPNFTCSHLAELMRQSGNDIRRKSEHEQAAVIHWFLGLYLEHGEKWEGIAKADIQMRVAAAGITVKGE